MNKNLYLLFLIILLSKFCLGQNKISGEARALNGSPLSFANILLLSKNDSSLVKGEVLSENGKFHFENIKNGEYLMMVSMVGFERVYHSVYLENNTALTIEPIIVKPIETSLNEITVSAKKPLFEQQADRLVVNVASSITASGGSALDVLQRSPGVTVDRQSSSLRMNGKGSVMVMINGKLTRLPMDAVIQMMEGMSASNIEKIELISSPPAAYDAEGDGGLINIVTKRNLDFGTNGTFSGTLGHGWYFRPAATLALNYRNSKLNIYGDYTFTNNHNRGGWTTYTTSNVLNNTYYNEFTIKWFNLLPSNSSKIGFDYNLGKQTIISGLLSIFNTVQKADIPSVSTTYLSKDNQTLINDSQIKSYQENNWFHFMINAALRHTFKNKNELSVDIDKLYYSNNNPSRNLIENKEIKTGLTFIEQIRVEKSSPVNLWVLKTDYTSKIDNNTSFDLGIKGSFTNLNNNIRLDRFTDKKWSNDARFSQNFEFEEDILAGYTNLSQTINTQSKFQAGLRYEHTNTEAKDQNGKPLVARNYGNFFPNFLFSHKYNKLHTFNITFNRRITRPSYKLLVPQVLFIDKNSLFTGNPQLLPTLSDNVQGSWVLNEKYTFSLRYSDDKNTMVQYQPKFDPESKELLYYTDNIKKVKTLAFASSIPFQITKWWQTQNTATGYRQNLQTTFQENSINRNLWNFQINTSHTFTLPKKVTMELTYYYVSANFWGIFKNLSKSETTFGIQKVLSKNKGTFRANISDIFWTNQGRWRGVLPTKNFTQDIDFFNEPRVVRLTYNRSFGNQKVNARQNRKTGSEEERQRF